MSGSVSRSNSGSFDGGSLIFTPDVEVMSPEAAVGISSGSNASARGVSSGGGSNNSNNNNSNNNNNNGGRFVRGLVIKAACLAGGAFLLKKLTKSTTRWDHARTVAQSLSGEKVSPTWPCSALKVEAYHITSYVNLL